MGVPEVTGTVGRTAPATVAATVAHRKERFMGMAEKAAEALLLLKSGDSSFDSGDFKASVSSHRRALKLSRARQAD